jgi:hypothetical protein
MADTPLALPPNLAQGALTDYEQKVLDDLMRWQQQGPSWGTRLLAKPSGAAVKAVQSMVPVEALRLGLTKANQFARKLDDRRDVLKRSGLPNELALGAQSLEAADRLAIQISRRAMVLGGVGGGVLGVTGAAGMVVDVPLLLTLALRTIHRTGYCYGELLDEAERERVAIGIFALASANSLDEKTLALEALAEGRDVVDDAWRDGLERVAEREMAKDAAAYSVQTLASRVGLHLGARKGAGVVPVLGALVGSSMNAWYLFDVSQTARRVFQWRRLTAGRPENAPEATAPA